MNIIQRNYDVFLEESKLKRTTCTNEASFVRPQSLTDTEAQALGNIYKDSWVRGPTGDPGWLNFGLIYGTMNLHPEMKSTQVLESWAEYNRLVIIQAGFSLMLPQYELTWHTDNNHESKHDNVFHLGLDIPGNNECYLEVEDKIYYEENRKIIKFCDSKLHRAFNNHTSAERMILYVQWE